MKEIWGTKYKSNDETIEHNHYPSSWSFVYYPNEVEGAPGLTFGEAGVERTIKKGMLLFISKLEIIIITKKVVLDSIKCLKSVNKGFSIAALIP